MKCSLLPALIGPGSWKFLFLPTLVVEKSWGSDEVQSIGQELCSLSIILFLSLRIAHLPDLNVPWGPAPSAEVPSSLQTQEGWGGRDLSPGHPPAWGFPAPPLLPPPPLAPSWELQHSRLSVSQSVLKTTPSQVRGPRTQESEFRSFGDAAEGWEVF